MLEPVEEESSGVDGRSTRWDAHNVQRRAEILDAAVAAIEENGPGIGIQQIADRVGLPRPVVYRHFQGRHDLDERIRQTIIDLLMDELAPALTPDGTVQHTIRRAVDTYLGWIERHPRLHHFLGRGSDRQRKAGSRVVAGTKTAIAVHVEALLSEVLGRFGKDTELAESMAFGLVGLVDAPVNRWLSDQDSALTPARLADFLTMSIWNVIDGYLCAVDVRLDPDTTVSELFSGNLSPSR